jgi:murein L,D-transpeptidase YcbB/YkuD
MFKKLGVLLFAAVIAAVVSGCATTGKQGNLEVQGLKNQVQVLKAQVQEKDQEIMVLKNSLNKSADENMGAGSEAATASQVSEETKSRPAMKDIQTALKNAGYDPGPLDGKSGKQTREAIKAFQKANNLTEDGKVGKKTWELLGKFLEVKEK